MDKSSLFRLAGWSAYVSAIATIIGAVTLVIFFSVGEPFGTINDVSSVLIGLTAILILFALYQILRPSAPTVSLVAFLIGAIAMLIAALLQGLLVINVLNFGAFGNTVTVMFGLFGASLVTFGWLAYSSGTMPRGLASTGIAAGIGYVLVNVGFIIGGPDHLLTYIGGALSVIAYPAWAFWLGRVLLKSN